ncbi:hypothetical protein [Streptomyces somaliensis]|uniref:hypothetical protein n=1 Tax=Streptomyces somaliensis TaxID=78355 RepID=UPI0027E4FF06|nr:hypothetical protein [Streptomyces somaliensis]
MPGARAAGLVELAGQIAQVRAGRWERQAGGEGADLGAQVGDGAPLGAVQDRRARALEGEPGGEQGAEGGGEEEGDDEAHPQAAGEAEPRGHGRGPKR